MFKRFYPILCGVLILCILLISACSTAPSTTSTAPIKIGIMFPLTGPMAMTGKNMVGTAEFAFNEINNEIAGKKVELIVEDSAASSQMAVDKARKLVENDKVCMIIGGLIGAEKTSISEYANKAGVPYIIPSPATWSITEHEWSFLAGGSNFQHPSVMATYAYDEMNLRTVTGITRDDGDGHDFLGAFIDTFVKKGGESIQEQYTPFGCTDFAPYLTTLKPADAVAGWESGADAVLFLAQYDEFGIRKKMPLVGVFLGSFFQPFILNILPKGVAETMLGEKCPSQWTPMVDTPISKKFVEDFQKATDRMPSEADSSPYSGAIIGIEALKSTNGDTTPEKLRQALLALDIEVPEGRIRFDPETRCAYRDIYIIEIAKMGDKYTTTPVKLYKDVPPRGL